MILEIVTFNLPAGQDRAKELDAVRGVTAKWAANPDLVRKQFGFGLGDAAGTGAGVYVWPSIEAAEKAHSEEWREAVKARTGGYPTIQYFDLLAEVDNSRDAITEWSPDGKAHDVERA